MDKHLFYKTYYHLGDTIIETPILQSLHYNYGYIITLFAHNSYICRDRISTLFRKAPFIHDLLFLTPEQLLCYGSHIFRLNDEIIEMVNAYHSDLFCQGIDHGHMDSRIKGDVFSSKNKFSSYSDGEDLYSYHSVMNHHGVDSRGFELYAGVANPLSLPSISPKVGVCIGSSDKIRRLPDKFFIELTQELKKSFQVYLFGHDYSGTTQGVVSLMNKFPLQTSIDYLNAMDVIITPDTGFFHVAMAFKKQTILIQSAALNDYLTLPIYYPFIHHYSIDDKMLNCKQDCMSKQFERYLSDGLKRPNQEFIKYKSKVQVRLVDSTKLSCNKNQEDMSCLFNLGYKDIKKITNMIWGIVKEKES